MSPQARVTQRWAGLCLGILVINGLSDCKSSQFQPQRCPWVSAVPLALGIEEQGLVSSYSSILLRMVLQLTTLENPGRAL